VASTAGQLRSLSRNERAMVKKLPQNFSVFPSSGWGVPWTRAGRTARAGTGVKIAALLHQQFRQPDDCRPRTRHVGDKARPSVALSTADGFAVCGLQQPLFY